MKGKSGAALACFALFAAWPVCAAAGQNIPYSEAKPIFDALRPDLIPQELRGKTPADIELAWPSWVTRRDADIRARLERGDEDSIFNLTLFGTTFTKQPRITERDIADTAEGRAMPSAVQGRIDDIIAGIAAPGTNERLQFARQVVARKSFDPETTAGRSQLRSWLDAGIARVAAEYRSHQAVMYGPGVTSTALSTLYRERGLSSDTTLFPGFGIEQALDALKSNGLLNADAVRRVAIVGPGLDFTDKHEGHDFYPPQTIQPFAVIDSLIRLGLATQADLRLTTFDLSPRINHHLETARERARAGDGYALQLPRSSDPFRWTPFLESYWERFGDKVGESVDTAAGASGATNVQVRAVRVRPQVVLSIVPQDLNIVLQRLDPLASPAEYAQFDLIVATNILLYYDVFEQALALMNIAKMLRSGGFFLTNTAVSVLPGIPMSLIGYTDVGYTERPEADRVFWYEKE